MDNQEENKNQEAEEVENVSLTEAQKTAMLLEAEQNEIEEKCAKIGCDSYLAFKNSSGKTIVAFVKKPSYLSSINALDMIANGKTFAAGNMLFSTCYDDKNSDKECEEDFYKKAIVFHISSLIEVAAPLFKKK